jgi:hypothetical protein
MHYLYPFILSPKIIIPRKNPAAINHGRKSINTSNSRDSRLINVSNPSVKEDFPLTY